MGKTCRACLPCQKAHNTCNDERPCQRCVQKGNPEECREGVRKLAKYLGSVDDELMYYYSGGSRSNNSSPIQATSDLSTSTGQTSLKTALSNNNAPAQSQRRNFFPVEEKDPLTFKRSANQILQGYLSDSSSGTISPKSAPLSKDPTSLFEENSQMKQPSNNNAENSDQSEESTNLSNIPFETYSDHESSFLSKRKLSHQYRQYCQGQPFSDIFDKVTQPWNYRQSHQKLIDYGESILQGETLNRFRVIVGSYKPSLLNTCQNYNVEDFTFREKSFQRALLEGNILLSMTGTPACIWRSTGELVAVNKEFLFLTGWNLSLLVERPCRIYELFDKDTFLNYYEEFGKSFSDACISHFLISCQIAKFPIAAAPTTLPMSGERQLSPQEWLPFQCWATIKRDIYDIPLMIMGHFLPSF